MRVVGHMAMVYRDLARAYILQEDWDRAVQVYQTMVQTLHAIDTASSKFADEIRLVLLQSAERDTGTGTSHRWSFSRGLSRFFDALED